MVSEPTYQRQPESDLDMATSSTTADQIRPGVTINGPFIPEPMELLAVVPFGTSLKVIGRGAKTGRSYDLVISPEQIAQLKVTGELEPFDGSAREPMRFARRLRESVNYRRDVDERAGIALADDTPSVR
jgi:hypothetical protein